MLETSSKWRQGQAKVESMGRLQGFKAFSDAQVREIKVNLIAGVAISTIARRFGVGEATVSRVKRGLTYQHVKVEGEEVLRPGVEVVEASPIMLKVMSGVTDEAAAESEKEFMEMMGMGKEEGGEVGRKEKSKGELDEIEKIAAGFFGRAAPKSLGGEEG